ncbi:MAG TPA: DUF3995 domain-containing protein [Ktedonobacterales bacterium]|nr:DUF3995 domain-containing protein [Ktedonobacterales bacterium]
MIAQPPGRFGRTTWAAYAACAWAMLFALMSFYWALGGDFGVNTLGSGVQSLAHDPGFIAVVWLTGIAKVLGGLFALTLVRPWMLWLPPTWKLALAWLAGIALALYGGIQLIIEGLVLSGVVLVSGQVDWEGLRWHVWLWDPWWLLGGILFLLAAWHYRLSLRATTQAPISADTH